MSTEASHSLDVDIPQLVTVAIGGLVPMFDASSQLFCYRVQESNAGLSQEGLSHRYTLISLLGLDQCEKAGLACGFDVGAITRCLFRDVRWLQNIGDLGLALWLGAVACPERLASISATWGIQNALGRFGEARYRRTMELAWFLAGLAHLRLESRSGKLPEYPDLAATVYRLLRQNQGDSGIFGHQAREGTFSGMLRGHVGSFADQVYPIYALAKYAHAYGVPDSLESARKCAVAICRAQGPQGQWWWQYDARTGTTAQRYPVYSVHQDGMAPMALFALADETRFDFTEAVYKGLRWISGNNEVGCDLRDMRQKVIWRSLHHASRFGVWRNRIRYSVGAGVVSESRDQLKILRECRPYHFGWLLYAFGGRSPSLGQGLMLDLEGNRERHLCASVRNVTPSDSHNEPRRDS